MTSIFLKNGKILLASDGRGLSQDCGCCDDPPPPIEGCDVCCFGNQEIDDSVSVSLELRLPSISLQVFSPSPSDNGIRIFPSVTLTGDGVLFVTKVNELQDLFSRIDEICLQAQRTTDWEYSNQTSSEFMQIRINYAVPLQEDGSWSPVVPSRCEVDSLCGFTLTTTDVKPTGGSNAVVDLTANPNIGSTGMLYFVAGGPQALQGQGPCTGEPVTIPLLFSTVFPPYPVVSQPEQGTELGFITINDVE